MTIENQKPKFYYGWIMVFLGFMIYAVVFVSAVSVNTMFITPICDDFQISRSTMTFFMTVSSVATLLSAPQIGKLMGKYSPKWVGMAFIALFGCALIGLSFTQNITQFYIVAVFRGVGFGGATILLVNVMINNWFGVKKKGVALGIATMGSSVGGFVVIPIITKIIDGYGWRWGYRGLAALMMCVMLLLMLTLAVDKPEQKGLTRYGDPDSSSGVPMLHGPLAAEAKKIPAFWILIIGYSLIVITTSAISNHAVPYFTDLGFARSAAAQIQSIGLLLMAGGKYLIGWLNDKVGGRKSILIGFIMLALCYVFMFSLSISTKLIPAYMLFYALGQSLPLLAPGIMISNTFGNRGFAVLVAWCTTGNGIGNAIGPFLLGKFYDVTGSYTSGWMFLAVITVIGGLMIVYGMRKSYRDFQSKATTR